MNEVLNTIMERRSVRAYKPDRLKRAEIDAIVEAGIHAPTGCNRQAWHFSVIQDRRLLEELNAKAKAKMVRANAEWVRKSGENPNADITHKAPLLILVSSCRDATTPVEDCSAAMQNMILAARSLGVGSCWLGFAGFAYADRELMGRLGVPEGYTPREAAVFGYPAEGVRREPSQRNPDVVNFVGEF